MLLFLYAFGYLLIPVALVVMIMRYRRDNWFWLALLVASLFVGVAPFVAIAYLVTAAWGDKEPRKRSTTSVTYYPDGSYTVYEANSPKTPRSPAKFAFQLVGGIVAGAVICFGLFVVGSLVFLAIACSGNSKCM